MIYVKREFLLMEQGRLSAMASLLNTRCGRPSKGPRHPFTVKLDMERAVKLAELLTILDVNGVAYLTPVVEAHLDSVNLDELRGRS